MKIDIVKAWKDAKYRESLSEEQLAQVPENPIGAFELSDADLLAVQGAGWSCHHPQPRHCHQRPHHGCEIGLVNVGGVEINSLFCTGNDNSY